MQPLYNVTPFILLLGLECVVLRSGYQRMAQAQVYCISSLAERGASLILLEDLVQSPPILVLERGGWLQDAVFSFQINDYVLIFLVIKVLHETHAQDLIPFGRHMVLTLWYVLEADCLLLRKVKQVTQLLLFNLDLIIEV